MAPDKIEGTENVPAPGGGDRDVITDPDVLSHDDLTTAPVGDAKVHEPPVRSALPNAPVAAGVGVGQGAHQPPDPDLFDRDGRVRDDVINAAAAGEQSDEPDGGSEPSDDGGSKRVEFDAELDDDANVAALVDGNDAAELERMASDRDLPTSGTKGELAERIVEHDRQAA